MESPINKMILLLNAGTLVVGFVLALGTQSSQIDLLGASAAYAGEVPRRRHGGESPAPIAYLRLLQSLEQFWPKEKIDALNPQEMGALYEALEHHAWRISEGVKLILAQRYDGAKTRAEMEKLSKDTRDAVHMLLSRAFRDAELVNRMTAAILGGSG